MFKDIPGFEGLYQVSDRGEVLSLRLGAMLKPMMCGGHGKKYPTVLLCNGDTKRARKVHHLVLEAFVGPRPAGRIACHRDDNKENNELSNLYWGTWSDNAQDRVRNGHHGGAKLNMEQVAAIRQRRAAGESGKSLAAEFGVSKQVIWNVKSGRTGISCP